MFFLLGKTDISEFSPEMVELFLQANLISEGSYGENSDLTDVGFRFMLEDISTQIHILLLNYIKMKRSDPKVLKLIFQLILSNNRSYKIIGDEKEMNFEAVNKILAELKQIGLIYQRKKKRFYITQLMRCFLLGLDSTEVSNSLNGKEMDKSIIVETNFRIY